MQVTDDRLHEPMDVDPNPEPMDIDPNPEPAPDRGEPMEVDLNENQLERLVSGNFAQLNCVTVLGAVLASSRTHHKRMLQSASTHETDSQGMHLPPSNPIVDVTTVTIFNLHISGL